MDYEPEDLVASTLTATSSSSLAVLRGVSVDEENQLVIAARQVRRDTLVQDVSKLETSSNTGTFVYYIYIFSVVLWHFSLFI